MLTDTCTSCSLRSQREHTGGSQSNKQSTGEETHTEPLSSQSRVRYQNQHEYSTKEYRSEGDAGSPPPHSSTTTTATTTTPTSEASSPRPGSSGSASAGSGRGTKPSLSSSIGSHFPQGTPSPAHGIAAHQIPSYDPVRGDISTSDEAQWAEEVPARGAQHPASGSGAVSAGPSQTTNAPVDDCSFPCAIKMLVSNNMAGSIIGRSGQTISDLQNQSSTRIKLSQTGDFFPGTQDRVCLVQGHADNVKKAMSLLLSRLYALQHQHYLSAQQHEQQHNPRAIPDLMHGPSEGPQSFSFVVRILVPSPSCGMIIGKGGSNIKQMVEASGVSSVRLSPKEGADASTDASGTSAALASATAERVVTIAAADLNCCIACLFIILDGMTSHPDICRYSNMTTSYSRVMSAAYDAAAVGRTVMSVPSQDSIPRGMAPPGLWDPKFAQKSHHELGMDLNQSGSFEAPPPSQSMAYRRSLSGPSALQTGFTHSPSSPHHFRGHEPVHAYSPMFGGPAVFVPPSPEYHHSPVRAPIPRSHSNASLPFGLMGIDACRPPSLSASAPDLLALQFQETLRMSDSHRVELSTPPMYGGSQQHSFTVQVAIPDSLIGSILGRGGRTLNELQVQSNTRIRISQRGEYVPGTKNRIVTIRGPTAHSVTMAQMLMSQCMVLPPTAVSPTTAFPIQPVERAYEEQQVYMPPSPTTSPPAPPGDSRQDPHIHHHTSS